MSLSSLDSHAPQAGELYYLDTSAMFSLGHLEAQRLKMGGDPGEVKRGKRVVSFVRRAAASSASVFTSVLAHQEIAAVVRNRLRNAGAQKVQACAWKQLKVADPDQADQIDVKAQTAALQMLSHVSSLAGREGIETKWPAVASDPVAAAKTLRKAHRDLLRLYRQIDSMDALHIVIGAELGALNFVTFDKGWDTVSNISVLA